MDPRLIKLSAYFAGSTLVGLYFASQIYFFYPPNLGGGHFLRCFVFNVPICWLWALTLPVVERTVRRFPLERRNWFPRLLLHAVVGVGLAILVTMGAELIIRASGMSPIRSAMSVGALLLDSIPAANTSYSSYWFLFVAVLSAQAYAKLRDREVRAAQLQASLSRAQLAALSAQLNPHFLFNALNSISALLYRDRDAADKMLSRLGELLRITLAADWSNEIVLRDELTLLRRYVEIEQLRFAERLSVELNVDEPLLDSPVPPFVLQPLVENAIHHGVSRRREGGRVVVRARSHADGLLLSVWDDGPGLAGGIARERVGLANTRARLAQLYGVRGGLQLLQPPQGGLEVQVHIPPRHR